MNVRRALPVALLLASASVARADEAPPNVSPCGQKMAGDACSTDDRKDGACAPQTCSRIDYGKKPPGTASYPCLTCVAGTKPTRESTSTKSGCTAAPGSRAGIEAAVGLGLVLFAAAARRRRR